ncbi:hypothetical protein [Streptomyces sp. NPDC048516]|uniref:hypothetical protein n=1 Tax=Streptomyces sp. NPDC048516 TaxID=3365565 RepID=UPI00371388F6
MSTPVEAEKAWADLQRIRVPQERVYDEMERCASSDSGTTYVMAAVMWVFLATLELDLPPWGVFATVAAYIGLMAALAVSVSRRTRMRAHRSVYTWRSYASFFAGALVTGGTVFFSGRLVEWLHLPLGGIIQATISVGVFLLFVGPANRWAVGTVRGRLEMRR